MILFCLCFLMKQAICQNNVGIGTTTPASDAVLELKSSTQGVLVPRMSTAQRLAIANPSNGLLVYDTNYNCFYYYNVPAIIWNSLCSGSTGPTKNSTTQIYTSQGDSTSIGSSTPITVNGLSLAVTLTDTATVIVSSNGNLFGVYNSSSALECYTLVQLYQNSVPILGTQQTSLIVTESSGHPNGIWSVSTVIPSLLPGTYLFELRAANLGCNGNICAAYNYNGQNQGIITAEVIY